MWIISFIALAGTAIVLPYMPDSVPMHYDMSGNIDRWGSKYENMIFMKRKAQDQGQMQR